ncbi:hypothetical protein NMY22_g3833 [Coprinellus aureogranulatus]|nr:hypothetical protein NMY22_g3833 [Coprinellus aureogranulatus]
MPAPYTAFFYGTLMHPKILKRVIQNDGSHLEICPGVLLNYTRHRVKQCEYPGIVPYERGKQLFPDRELEQEERSVRGTIVRGLSLSDIGHLDTFEGDEYERLPVSVHPLEPFTPLNTPAGQPDAPESLIPQHATPLPPVEELGGAVDAHTYVFQDIRYLEPRLWSWDEFMKNSAWKWYGGSPDEVSSNGSDGLEDLHVEVDHIPEVERRRAAMLAFTGKE